MKFLFLMAGLLMSATFSLSKNVVAQAGGTNQLNFQDYIVTRSDGSLFRTVQSRAHLREVGKDQLIDGAVEHCGRQGKHLATAREFAQYAQKLGAKGILEKQYILENLKGKVPDGYRPIDVVNDSDGTRDQFYFNFDGYSPPPGDVDNIAFWTASHVRTEPELAFAFWEMSGAILDDYRDDGLDAIICLPMK